MIVNEFILERLFASKCLDQKGYRRERAIEMLECSRSRYRYYENLRNVWRLALERRYQVDSLSQLWVGPTPYEDEELTHMQPFPIIVEQGRFDIPTDLPEIRKDEVSKDFVHVYSGIKRFSPIKVEKAKIR